MIAQEKPEEVQQIGVRNVSHPSDFSSTSEEPPLQPAIQAVRRVTDELGLAGGTVTLLHVGRSGEIPTVEAPRD